MSSWNCAGGCGHATTGGGCGDCGDAICDYCGIGPRNLCPDCHVKIWKCKNHNCWHVHCGSCGSCGPACNCTWDNR